MAATACALLQTARNAGLSWVRELAAGRKSGYCGSEGLRNSTSLAGMSGSGGNGAAPVSESGAAACTAAATRGVSAGENSST